MSVPGSQGKTIHYEKDPAKLQALIDQARAKSRTKMISLRLPVDDLDTLKRLASKHGVGYQIVLKEIIHAALQQAS